MSELIQQNDNRATIHWKLLTGASALALTAYISSTGMVRAEDGDHVPVWIEFGGQLSRLQDGQETFTPAFPTARPDMFSSSQKFERPPLYSIDESGKISFQPGDSDWVLSASIRYGRSLSSRHVHQQTYPTTHIPSPSGGVFYLTGLGAKFADTHSRNSEDHLTADFEVGKDVGLGLLGEKGSSVISAGIRLAQFNSKSNTAIKSAPDWHIKYFYYVLPLGQIYHSNWANLSVSRSFKGIGPTLSWSMSAPFAGNGQDGELALDWGVNAALLFGKQKARIHQQTTRHYHAWYDNAGSHPITHQGPATPDHTRSRRVTVPNVGGFAGISWRYDEAKVSFGYKADFFFGAIDGGIDTRKDENRAFYGPYASISIGLGD